MGDQSETSRRHSLDGVDLKDRFKSRACVMRTVPHIMKGALRLGLRAALEEVLIGQLSTERRKDGQRVEVVHASAEDDAPQTTKRRTSAKEEIKGTSPTVAERPVVAVVGEKSFQ